MGPYTGMIAGIIVVCGCLSRGFFCQNINLEAINMPPTPTLPFFPPQGQEQVHDCCFERPNWLHVENVKIFHHFSVQRNILETCRQKFTLPDTRLCQRYRCSRFTSPSLVRRLLELALSWQPIWGKWNANRAAKFVGFSFLLTAAAANQRTLRMFLCLDSPLRPRWIMKGSSKQSHLRYREVWDENQATSVCSSSSHRAEDCWQIKEDSAKT